MSRRGAARRADLVHWRFRALPGSDFVASGFAIAAVIDLVERRRPRSILEVGAGIGTMTAALAETLDRTHQVGTQQVAVEEIDFCLGELRANLGPRLASIVVVPRAKAVPAHVADYDLVVVDGGAVTDLDPADRHHWTAEDERAEVRAWMGRLAPRAVVIVENERPEQRSWIELEALRSFVHEHVRPLDATPGYHRYQFDPTRSERIASRARDRVRRWWFPRGVRLLRRVHHRLTGRVGPNRTAVAPGEPER